MRPVLGRPILNYRGQCGAASIGDYMVYHDQVPPHRRLKANKRGRDENALLAILEA